MLKESLVTVIIPSVHMGCEKILLNASTMYKCVQAVRYHGFLKSHREAQLVASGRHHFGGAKIQKWAKEVECWWS